MMIKTNVKKLIALVLSAILFATASIPNATAAEEPRILLGLDSVNEIALTTTFHFPEGKEIVDTFKVYRPLSVSTGTKLATSVGLATQSNSGFDAKLSTPRFILEKVVGDETPFLYKATDETHYTGGTKSAGGNQNYKEFEVDVTFQRGADPLRSIHYHKCIVSDYYVYTEFDAEETYNAKTKFVYIDAFTFECRGLDYGNPIYNKVLAERQKPSYLQ